MSRDIEHDETLQLLLIQNLLTYVKPGNTRQRKILTYFKIVHGLFMLEKNAERKSYDSLYPSFETISKASMCGRRQVSEFVNAPHFQMFCELRHRPSSSKNRKQTHSYKLKPWVTRVLDFFWRNGMMKYYTTDHKKWHSLLLKRIKNGMMPELEKGRTFEQIEKDDFRVPFKELSTKKTLKGNIVKGNCMKPSGIYKPANSSLSISKKNHHHSLYRVPKRNSPFSRASTKKAGGGSSFFSYEEKSIEAFLRNRGQTNQSLINEAIQAYQKSAPGHVGSPGHWCSQVYTRLVTQSLGKELVHHRKEWMKAHRPLWIIGEEYLLIPSGALEEKIPWNGDEDFWVRHNLGREKFLEYKEATANA